MRIVFGTAFYGKIATLNNQWVETKFFHLWFIPLVPIGSILVTSKEFTSRKGVEIPTCRKSILATYMRFVSLLFSLWFATQVFGLWHISFYLTEEEAHIAYIWLWVKILLSLSACIYTFFYFGRSSAQEVAIREKIASVTGVYALPEWFDFINAKDRLRTYLHDYKVKYPEGDWKVDLQSSNISTEKKSLLFAIALFNCMVFDLPENEELYYKADSLYQLKSIGDNSSFCNE